jgi:hypothetical protein
MYDKEETHKGLSVSSEVVRENRHFINHYAESGVKWQLPCQFRMVADEPA